MKVIISAGGTGGHIYPALAIIDKIKEREPSSTFLYIGTTNRMEKDIVPKRKIDYLGLDVKSLDKKHPFKTLKDYKNAYLKCQKVIKEFKPDIVIGVGGYVTVPVILVANKFGIKIFLHEQNSVPGKANLFLSKYASKIGVSFKSSLKCFPQYKTVLTGNPCSDEAIKQVKISKNKFDLTDSKKLVLIVMGSLGSSKINEYLIKIVNNFENKDYEVLLVTGSKNYEMFNNIKVPKNVKIVPYIDELTRIMKQTDLMVSRSGASALSEIISLEIPSILIPSPYVANNHQYKNAVDLINNDAAILLEEKDLKEDILVKTIDNVINNSKRLNEIKNNIKPFKIEDSSLKIYEVLKELVGKK